MKTKVKRPLAEDEAFLDWETDLCDSCRFMGQEVAWNDDGVREKWLCLGEILIPDDPADEHERHNVVRMCTVADEGGIHVQDWTAFEACRAAFALIAGVSNYLIREQPKIDDVKP